MTSPHRRISASGFGVSCGYVRLGKSGVVGPRRVGWLDVGWASVWALGMDAVPCLTTRRDRPYQQLMPALLRIRTPNGYLDITCWNRRWHVPS